LGADAGRHVEAIELLQPEHLGLPIPCRLPLDALRVLAGAVLARFASKLGTLSHSTLPYLRRNILQSTAHLRLSAERVEVCFRSCPLQVVLRMAGCDRGHGPVPWLGGRRLEFRYD
jgi:hypothetical protein